MASKSYRTEPHPWPSKHGAGSDLTAAERIGHATPPGSPAPAARPVVIRYQLRYPPQAPFAASRPGAITRVLD